jgi:hypothetical protein
LVGGGAEVIWAVRQRPGGRVGADGCRAEGPMWAASSGWVIRAVVGGRWSVSGAVRRPLVRQWPVVGSALMAGDLRAARTGTGGRSPPVLCHLCPSCALGSGTPFASRFRGGLVRAPGGRWTADLMNLRVVGWAVVDRLPGGISDQYGGGSPERGRRLPRSQRWPCAEHAEHTNLRSPTGRAVVRGERFHAIPAGRGTCSWNDCA